MTTKRCLPGPANQFKCPACGAYWFDHEVDDPGPEFCRCGKLTAPMEVEYDNQPVPIPELDQYFQ